MVARDLALVRLTGAPMHFLHLSTAGSVELVRAAKAEGLAVTAEAAPHHFVLTDAEVAGYDPVFRVNPPLRSASDVAAVRQGLADGTIDAVATDHAPHTPEAKDVPFDEAPPGMLGLETALSLSFSALGSGPEEGPGGAARRRGPCRRPVGPRAAQLAAGGHRRARRRGAPRRSRHGPRRPGRPGVDGQPLRLRPRGPTGWSTRSPWPAAAATPPTPGARSSAGSATRSCGASRWSSTPRPSGEPRGGGRRRTAAGVAGPGRRRGLRGRGGRGRPDRCRPASSCSTPPSAATRRWSPTPPTPARWSPSPTRTSATTGSTPPTTRPAGPSAAGWSSAT